MLSWKEYVGRALICTALHSLLHSQAEGSRYRAVRLCSTNRLYQGTERKETQSSVLGSQTLTYFEINKHFPENANCPM